MLYFAYTARIAPETMAEAAPGAEFQFIAHLPEWGLAFPKKDRHWNGGLPTVQPESGSTVWGAVFKVPDDQVEALNAAESGEGRDVTEIEAMDRTGRRHVVTTHVIQVKRNGAHKPSAEYVKLMLAGSRHWSLPAGWIAGLEEHLENSG